MSVECYSWLGQWKGPERGYIPVEGNFVRHADYLALVDAIRVARLEWALICHCDCAACATLHNRLQKMCGDVVTAQETGTERCPVIDAPHVVVDGKCTHCRNEMETKVCRHGGDHLMDGDGSIRCADCGVQV
jgi:hypothetical protein